MRRQKFFITEKNQATVLELEKLNFKNSVNMIISRSDIQKKELLKLEHR